MKTKRKTVKTDRQLLEQILNELITLNANVMGLRYPSGGGHSIKEQKEQGASGGYDGSPGGAGGSGGGASGTLHRICGKCGEVYGLNETHYCTHYCKYF